jgi:thymidylate kinase
MSADVEQRSTRLRRRGRGFTVALIGPDGAGKTSVSRRLAELGLPVKRLYMGVNLEESRVMLPTTRLLLLSKRIRGRRPDLRALSPETVVAGSNSPVRRLTSSMRASLRVLLWVGEEWFRQFLAWRYQREGYIVVFDRHFFCDYHTADVVNADGRRASSRIHGVLLSRLYPKPDIVVYLDAPPEVLRHRKPETPHDYLVQRRADYSNMKFLFRNFVTVDATRPTEEVTAEVAAAIEAFSGRAG